MLKISPTDLILNPDGSVYHLNLLPEHLTDTIITVGDPDRVPLVSQYFDKILYKVKKREFVTHHGILGGKAISVISTGIGTDNVEIFLNEIDALANIDLLTRLPNPAHRALKIIRIGTSGALRSDIELDSHLVSEFAVGLDNLMSFYGLTMNDIECAISESIREKAKLPFLPYVVKGSGLLLDQIGKNMMIGNTVTCPGFYAPQGRTLRVPIRLPNLLKDMGNFIHGDFKLNNFEMETAGYYSLGKLLAHDVISVNAIIANRATGQFSANPEAVINSLIKKVLDRI